MGTFVLVTKEPPFVRCLLLSIEAGAWRVLAFMACRICLKIRMKKKTAEDPPVSDKTMGDLDQMAVDITPDSDDVRLDHPASPKRKRGNPYLVEVNQDQMSGERAGYKQDESESEKNEDCVADEQNEVTLVKDVKASDTDTLAVGIEGTANYFGSKLEEEAKEQKKSNHAHVLTKLHQRKTLRKEHGDARNDPEDLGM